MYNNPLYLNRTILDIASLPADKALVFHQGELLQGLVKAIHTDGTVLLALKGRMIEASARVPVEVGQNLFLMVDQAEAGRVRLKIMTPAGIQQIEDRTIAERLMEIGISPQAKEAQMARQLLSYNLGINRHNLDMMNRSTAMLGEATPENINLAAFQLARNLPQHPAVLQSLARYSSPGSDVITLIQDVLRLVSTDYPAEEAPQPQNRADNLPQAGIKPAHTTAAAMPKQEQALISSPSSHPAGDKPYMPVNSAVVHPPAASGDILKQLLILVRQQLNAYRLEIGAPAPALSSRLEDMVRSQPEMLRGLLVAEDMMNEAGKSGIYRPGSAVLSRLEALSREIMGQQVINLPTPAVTEEAPQCYFALPVQIGEERRRCEIHISGEPGQSGLREQEQINVAVSLDTPALGAVLFHVTWHKSRFMEIRSVVESQASYDILQLYLPELYRALENLGYTVRDCGMKVSPPGEPAQSLKIVPRPPENHGPGWRSKVDIKV
jgi:hypothetical protein